MKKPHHKVHAVLITGASSGIGEACSLVLAEAGYSVYAGIRRQQDADSLQKKSEGRIRPIFLDVTDEASIQAAYQLMDSQKDTYQQFSLFNNAGIAMGGPLAYIPLERLQQQLDVNLFGPLRMTQVFLPLLRERNGRILMMSSVAGQNTFPFLGPYCISKYGLEATSDALRMELRRWKIPVSILQPGKIKTPIWEKSAQLAEALILQGNPQALEDYARELAFLQNKATGNIQTGGDPRWVVEAVLHALTAQRPKTRYPIGPDAIVLQFFRWLPDWLKDWGILKRSGML